MKKIRALLGAIILGSLVLVAVLTWRLITPPAAKNPPPGPPPVSADLSLDRVHYTETREGRKEWELEAASARYYKEENTVLLSQVKATFFGEHQEAYVLVADKGKYNTQTKAIEVFGGVKLDSTDGYHVRTRALKYESEKRELTTADPVEMSGPQIRIEGIGLIVDLEKQRMKVLRQVTTTLSRPARKDT